MGKKAKNVIQNAKFISKRQTLVCVWEEGGGWIGLSVSLFSKPLLIEIGTISFYLYALRIL